MWWRVGEYGGDGDGDGVEDVRAGEGGRRRSGGERSLRQFLSLRVESSQERAAVYAGEDVVSVF